MTSTHTVKREPRAKPTPRADQLRPLNRPQPVRVELDVTGLPAAVAVSCRSETLPIYNSTPLQLGSTAADEEEEIEETEHTAMGRTTGGKQQALHHHTTPITRHRSLTIESILEIWHVDDEWWREPISRRYVEVILEGGKHVVLYEDLIGEGWFVQMP